MAKRRRADWGATLRRRNREVRQVLGNDAQGSVPGEWHGLGDKLVEHAACCVDVGPSIDIFSARLFWGHILGRPTDEAAYRNGRATFGLHDLRDSKVTDFHVIMARVGG